MKTKKYLIAIAIFGGMLFTAQALDQDGQTLKSQKLESQDADNKSIVIGSIVATLIAITPYLFYLYESVPAEKVWDTFLFTYSSLNYNNANVAMWLLTGKLVPVFLLFIWFYL